VSRPLAALAAVAIVLTGVVRLHMSGAREFGPDEFQHLHAAWCVSQGLVPYRDFFEHHMPALAMALPLTTSFPSLHEGAPEALRTMKAARLSMSGWLLGILSLTALLGARTAGLNGGLIAVTLLTLGVVFTGKGLEIRPDTPATFWWLLALCFLIDALETPGRRRFRLFASGVALGIAVAFTQKLLMAGPGFAAISVWAWTRRTDTRPLAVRVGDTILQAAGVLLPLAVILFWFARQGAASIFVHATLFQNLGWVVETTAQHTIEWVALRDPALLAAGVIGIVRLIAGLRPIGEARPIDVVLSAASVSLVIGLLLIPAPYPQYLLPLFPLLAVASAMLLLRPSEHHLRWLVAAGTSAAALTFLWASPYFLNALVYPVVVLVAVVVAAVASRRRADIAICAIVAAFALYPVQQLRWMYGLGNAHQLQALSQVDRLTNGPHATVLDGFTGLGWFRMHAWRPHFLHAGVRARLTAQQQDALASALRSGRISPGAVLFDEHLRRMSPGVVQAIETAYEPTGIDPVWQPRPDTLNRSRVSPPFGRP
jgi:hypothetical protein